MEMYVPGREKETQHDFNKISEEEQQAARERVNQLIREKVERETQQRVKEEICKAGDG